VASCAERCARAWPTAAQAESRLDCFRECRKCLTRKRSPGVCQDGATLRCCNGPGEPACCGSQCCGDGERCCVPQSNPAAAGRCVDLQADRENCGVCDNVCAQDQACTAGTCVASCPSGNCTTCPPDKTLCSSPDNTFGISGCCDAGQLCCPLAQSAYLCSAAGGKCCDFPTLLAPGVLQYPCPNDHTCCGGIPPGGTQTIVGCCPPGYACGTDVNGAPECQFQ
jgi:hypothetical protein